MKKIILVLSMILVIGLGACSSAPDNLDEQRLDELEARIVEIEYTLDNLGILTGLNGQQSYYTIPQDDSIDSLFKRVSAETVELATGLDRNKLPEYLFDNEDNPVEFDNVGQLLLDKYYGEGISSNTYFKVGFQTKMRYAITDETMSIDELIVRTVMMIEELSLYEYWLIGGSELYLQITFNDTNFEMFIYMPNLLSDAFNLTLEDYYNEHWEIEITNLSFNLEQAQIYYDYFLLDNTFANYVLNYE